MSDQSNAQPPAAATEVAAPATDSVTKEAPPAVDVKMTGTEADASADAKPAEASKADVGAEVKPVEAGVADSEAPKPATETEATEAEPEAKNAATDPVKAVAATPSGDAVTDNAPEKKAEEAPNDTDDVSKAEDTPSAVPKRPIIRKSSGPSGTPTKKLNKKGSRARILHLNAKPGEHYFVKLKGYPQWPAIVCDEDMLPQTLIKSRPVSAARPDGSYREDYADGGKRAADRTFPVMYLHTNEFGWVPNSDLHDLEPEKVMSLVNDKMRKDLARAHELASEHHSLDHYKDVLQQFQDELDAAIKAETEALNAPAKKSRKSKGPADDEDLEMADADDSTLQDKKSKKRKAADETATPQRSDSVKKPKIKLTSGTTPKTANGTSTPKSAKAADTKKPKSKKAEEKKDQPKEPELSPEEKHERKQKEVLFLRHKLQKGLLTRDQEPKEEEMKTMSDYVTKLEGYPDLEVSIIRATKINKVLKAILKLESIPKEEEFHFKPRSQVLLDKWNKLLAVEGTPSAAAPANGVNGSSLTKEKEATPKQDTAKETNGVKEDGEKSNEKKEESKPSEAAAEAVEAEA